MFNGDRVSDTHVLSLFDLFGSYSAKDTLLSPGTNVSWVNAIIQRLRVAAILCTSENISTTSDADAFPDWGTFYGPDGDPSWAIPGAAIAQRHRSQSCLAGLPLAGLLAEPVVPHRVGDRLSD